VEPKTKDARRSGCPVSVSLDLLGDRWSLLLIRDMMVRGYRTFGEFQHSGEGIATNILAGRLRRLETGGLVCAEPAAGDGRSIHYRLTEKGIALAPVLLELLIWAARHEKTDAPKEVIDQMAANREWVLKETRRRWEDHDATPLLPPFQPGQGKMRKTARMKKSRSEKR
jgi:DNA-binding HxlR family transcriptional regulator